MVLDKILLQELKIVLEFGYLEKQRIYHVSKGS
jgi:hypothetical protein